MLCLLIETALPAELSVRIDIAMCGLRLGIDVSSSTSSMCCASIVVCPVAYSSASSAVLKAMVDCVLMCSNGVPQHVVIVPLVLFLVVLQPAQSLSALDSAWTSICPCSLFSTLDLGANVTL
eukprot:5993257-Amphidinium_carterae.3